MRHRVTSKMEFSLGPYLYSVFALNFPDFTICAICILYTWMLSSIETAPLCKIFKKTIKPLFMEILHIKYLGDTSVVSECSLGVNLVIDNLLYVVSDTSHLYKI